MMLLPCWLGVGPCDHFPLLCAGILSAWICVCLVQAVVISDFICVSVLLCLKNDISLKPCLSFLAAVRDPWVSRGKGVIKTSQSGLSAPKSLPSACCLSVMWVSVWLYSLRQGASLLRVEQCIDLHGIPGYLQMKLEKCRGSISPAPPLSKLFICWRNQGDWYL